MNTNIKIWHSSELQTQSKNIHVANEDEWWGAKFKNMMLEGDNCRNLYNTKPELFNQFKKLNSDININSWEDLDDILRNSAELTNHPIFNFIEIF